MIYGIETYFKLNLFDCIQSNYTVIIFTVFLQHFNYFVINFAQIKWNSNEKSFTK